MKASVSLFMLIVALPASAHQPVMDMAPRWADGYGFQLRTSITGQTNASGEAAASTIRWVLNDLWIQRG